MKFIYTALFTLLAIFSFAQDVMLQGWYWDYPKTASGHEWTDTLNDISLDLGEAGFTHIWMPPFTRASFGSNSNGYDPQDLYDLGEFGLGATGFGTRAQVDALISAFNTVGIETVADVVYNHRDGGKAENNPAVEGWIENLDCTKINNGDQAYPSDRVRFVLPIGGSTGNGAGTYYIKVRSASLHPNFYDYGYKFYIETNTYGYQGLPAMTENEAAGNGGGDCSGQGSEVALLGVDMLSTVDNVGACGGFCGLDEYAVTVSASQFNAAGDSLYIYMNNTGGYSDHYISGIWNGSANVQSNLLYQTYTDFTSMPSGQGAMNYTNFKPNGNPTNLGGDWDSPLFFYDYDQNTASTRQELIDWTQWLWNDVGVRGLRMDAVKHFDPAFVSALLDSLHNVGQNPSMVVGEFYDFSASALNNWVNSVKANTAPSTDASIDVKVFDFALRGELKNACDLFGYDARNVFNSGIVDGAGGLSTSAVTFVNNHDFRDAGQPIQNDPLLTYAYILTNRKVGTPTVYYPDYAGKAIPNAPTQDMSYDIDRLIETFNSWMKDGSYDYMNRFSTPYTINYNSGVDNASLIYQTSNGGIDGTNDGIVLINFAGDTLDIWMPMSSGSSKTTGTVFYETTGKGIIPNSTVDGNNYIRLAVPPRSYGVWVSAEVNPNCNRDSLVYVDINATGLNNGTSWENAYSNLGAALGQANYCSDIEEIWIKEGTYTPTILDDRAITFSINEGLIVRGGFPSAGSPTISDYDPVNNLVILSGDIGVSNNVTDNSFHVISAMLGDTIRLNGLTLKGGNANGAGTSEQSGGGIYNNFVVYMKDCTITDNTATSTGNAIFTGSNSTLILEDCKVENNSGSSTEIFLDNGGTIISRGNTEVKD